MSLATSSALRLRYRQQQDSDVVLDSADATYKQWKPETFVPKSYARRSRTRELNDETPFILDGVGGIDVAIFDRTLVEPAIDLTDFEWVTYERREPGERVESLLDSDSFNVTIAPPSTFDSLVITDNVVVQKSTSPVLFDVVYPTDEGFITDRDLERYRLTFDSFSLTDGFNKTIVLPDASIVNRVLIDDLVITDSIFVSFTGINTRTVSDSIVVNDFDFVAEFKERSDSADVNDFEVIDRFINRILTDSISVTDDMVVSRNAIISSVTKNDNISTADFVFADRIAGKPPKAAKVKHGIELY